jgi:small conductance mechanosensitive channel
MLKESIPVQRIGCRHSKLISPAILLVAVYYLLIFTVLAQESFGTTGEQRQPTTPASEELSPAPAKVDVNPVARDEEISRRLQSVLEATNWFTGPQVRVEEGVVFLLGQVESEVLKKWAGDLARNTQDVVAVVNRMEVIEPSAWDFRPAWHGLLKLWRDVVHSFPFFVFGLFTLALSACAGILATKATRIFLHGRIRTKLLQNVIARGVGGLVVLCGAYLILRVSGLTQLALTVVGGTGLIGLVIGIAFRDITENFLASIFLSMQRPFDTGDLVEISGETGYVQQLNMRTTILINLSGNLVQIPNSSVYKSTLRNFTTTPSRREEFMVGIGYDDAINAAQEIVRKVLAEHPAVLNDPEPSVLVDNLGSSTVNLRVYFWLNGHTHSWLKVRSSVIRLVKLAFQKHGISMPDEAREIVFPQGVHVTLLDEKTTEVGDTLQEKRFPVETLPEDLDAVSTKAEAGLYSEAVVIKKQARQAQPLQEGENLLPVASGTANSEK